MAPRMTLMLVAAAGLVAANGCGTSNKCSRACKKIDTCLEQRQDAPADDSNTSTGGACSLGPECTEADACRADCVLAASCAELVSGAVASCIAACGQTTSSPPPKTSAPATDSGLLAPLSGEAGPTCVPDCYAKQCGDDGCGGSCGSCGWNQSCSYGTCVSGCTPDCYGKQCGDDGCGGSCGSCGWDETCSYGACVPASSSNSGQLCTQSTVCPGNEGCLLFAQGATTGMCLGTCTTPGDPCPVPNAASQLAACAFTAQGSTQYYCAFLCELSGQSYACPNAYDYLCQALDPSAPDIKFCVPK